MNGTQTNEGSGEQPGRSAADVPGQATRPHTGDAFDIWRIAHRALRGRYRQAFLIAAAGAAIGASAGMMLGQRLYSATGVIRIASVLPQVMRETDQNRPMAMFDGFIQAQKEVITSRELVETAMKDEGWQRIARNSITSERFASSLKVETRHRSDHLRVIFTDKDPTIAAAAVRSLVSAYEQSFTREQDRLERQRMGQLTTRRDNLQQELQKLQAEFAPVAQGRTTAELNALYTVATERLRKLRSALADVQCAIAGGPDVGQGPVARSPGEIADDEILRMYAAELARVENQLAQARARGCTPAHATVIRLQAMARECRDRVAQYASEAEERRAMRGTAAASMSLAEREASLRQLTLSAEEELRQLTSDRAQLAIYDEKVAALQKSLGETENRMEALAMEASVGSRLTVINSGDRPLTARIDRRAKTAALGAFAGVAAPMAWLVFSGMRRPRYRFCDEAAAGLLPRVPFLAVLPELTGDDAATAAAVHCIHDLRVRLQPPANSGPRTYLVTSASAGEGKSSVAAALALSFAAAGYRTLLIDADLASRGLTTSFEAIASPGLLEATAGQDPSLQRIRTGLSVLTAGNAAPQDACKLAPAPLGRVLFGLRSRFDIVIIDSDSVLSGLTASLIAPHADGVILTLARDQEEPLVESALKKLTMLGATLSGAVFNRAAASDWLQRMPTAPSAAAHRVLPERLDRFGPLVSAMLSSLALSRQDELDLIPAAMTLTQPDIPQRAVA